MEIFDRLVNRLSDAVNTIATPPGVQQFVAVREDFEIVPVVSRAPSPGRRHVFADVESFAAFVLKHLPDGMAVEVLADTDRIAAVSGPTWSRDEITCVLTKHPDFLGWEAMFGRMWKQKALVRELIARGHTLIGEEGIVGHLQKLDVSNVSEITSHVTEHGNYEIAGQRQTTKMSAKLPGSFRVDVPVYLDRPAHTLIVGVVIEDVSGEPTFSLRPRNLDVVKLAAYREEVARLRSLLGAAYLVGAGRLGLE